MADNEYEFSTRNTVFFLGAGASQEAGIPLVNEFVPEFLGDPRRSEDGEQDLKRQAIEYISNRLGRKKRSEDEYADIELLLQTIEELRHRDNSPLAAFYEAEHEQLKEYDPILDDLEEELFQYIRHRCHVPLTKLEYLRPLLDFAPRNPSKEQSPLDIFTVNYDNAIEALCEEHDLPYTDGFGPNWGPGNFDRGTCCVRIYRIHGSISWYRTRRKRSLVRIPVDPSTQVRYYTDDETSEMMLYPTFTKAEQGEPYATLLEQMRRRLSSSETKTCVVIGYSFRDEYLNELFRNAMHVNRDLLLVVVDPSDAEEIAYHRLAAEDEQSFPERVVIRRETTGESLGRGELRKYLDKKSGNARNDEALVREEFRRSHAYVGRSATYVRKPDEPYKPDTIRCIRNLMGANMHWRGVSLTREVLGDISLNNEQRNELMGTVLAHTPALAHIVPVAAKLRQSEQGADVAKIVTGGIQHLQYAAVRLFADGTRQPQPPIIWENDFPGMLSSVTHRPRELSSTRNSLAAILEKTHGGWEFARKPGGAEAENALEAFDEAVRKLQQLCNDIDGGRYDGNEIGQRLMESCAASSQTSPSATFKQFAVALGLSMEEGWKLELCSPEA